MQQNTKKINWVQAKALEKAVKKYEKMKETWKTNDEKTKQKIIAAIWKIAGEEITLYEDDQQTKPTTIQDLQRKNLDQLTELFDQILQEIRTAALGAEKS